MVFLRTITLVIVCLLLTSSLSRGEKKPLSEVLEEFEQKLKRFPDEDSLTKALYPGFKKIKLLGVAVSFPHEKVAEKVGLDAYELMKYTRLRVKNNFANIKLGNSNTKGRFSGKNVDSYTDEQLGNIKLRVFIIGTDYPIAYHIRCRFLLGKNVGDGFRFYNKYIWELEMMGISNKDEILNAVKKGIDGLIEVLATDFFTVRGEL